MVSLKRHSRTIVIVLTEIVYTYWTTKIQCHVGLQSFILKGSMKLYFYKLSGRKKKQEITFTFTLM